MTDAILTTRSFPETLNVVEKDWGNWVDDLKLCDAETQDLLHEIELTNFDKRRGHQLCKQLQEVRKRRRNLKEKMELLRSIKEFVDSNRQLKISLFKTLTSMERTEESQGERSYYPRVRNDLELAKDREAIQSQDVCSECCAES